MKFRKIISIKNLGKFQNTNPSGYGWDGELKEVNVIYAPNGSGKTTLAILFKSIQGGDHLPNKKHSFKNSGEVEIRLLKDDNKQLIYKNNKWSEYSKDVEVFDSFYVEENIYIISIKKNDIPDKYYDIILGEESAELKRQVLILEKKVAKLISRRTTTLNEIKGLKTTATPLPVLETRLEDDDVIRKSFQLEIKNLEEIIATKSGVNRARYLERINHYLSLLNPVIRITDLQHKKSTFVYSVEIDGHQVRDGSGNTHSLRYSLSEGDKTSLALSFFFARLDLFGEELKNKVVVFDDPISSFDYGRKNTTINQLIKFGRKVKQLFLLTHDIQFAKDFSEKMPFNNLNIKIFYDGKSSQFDCHDITDETMTGIFKDLTVLSNFFQNGLASKYDPIDVKRRIRPTLEGFLRIKYFGFFGRKDWLGDMISAARDSNNQQKLKSLIEYLDDVEEINDYSKDSHHSNPSSIESSINTEELRNYVLRTLDLVKKL